MKTAGLRNEQSTFYPRPAIQLLHFFNFLFRMGKLIEMKRVDGHWAAQPVSRIGEANEAWRVGLSWMKWCLVGWRKPAAARLEELRGYGCRPPTNKHHNSNSTKKKKENETKSMEWSEFIAGATGCEGNQWTPMELMSEVRPQPTGGKWNQSILLLLARGAPSKRRVEWLISFASSSWPCSFIKKENIFHFLIELNCGKEKPTNSINLFIHLWEWRLMNFVFLSLAFLCRFAELKELKCFSKRRKSWLKEWKSINGAGLNSTNPIQLHLIDFFHSPAASINETKQFVWVELMKQGKAQWTKQIISFNQFTNLMNWWRNELICEWSELLAGGNLMAAKPDYETLR